MPIPSDTLRELIMQAQCNDPAAYEQLYQRYVDALYRYLTAQCNDAVLAEEALGDLWLRVVQYLPRFRIPEEGVDQAFSSWLYRIARNLAIDARHKARRPVDRLVETLPAADGDLDDALLVQYEHRSLAAALATLTVDQREVIVLRFYEDHTLARVASVTGRSESAVKALQHRALGTLARKLGVSRPQAAYAD